MTSTSTADQPPIMCGDRSSPAAARPPNSLNRSTFTSVVVLALLYLLMVGTPVGQELDQAAMQQISSAIGSTGWAERILDAVSAGSILLATGIVAVTTAVLRGRRQALIGAAAGAAVFAIAEILKLTLQRPDWLGWGAENSFPSGHVAAVAGVGVAFLLGVPRQRRWLAALLAAVPAGAVTGLATVALQWHRPSDAIASALLAVGIGALAVRLVDRPPAERPPTR